MTKIKRAKAKKVAPSYKLYLCGGCGYEYNAGKGDPEGEVAPGTKFKDLPEEWVCPECGEEKDVFIEGF